MAGDSHLNVENSMIKQRVDLSKREIKTKSHTLSLLSLLFIVDGRPIGKKMEERLSEVEQVLKDLPPDYCGSCYGAETHSRRLIDHFF